MNTSVLLQHCMQVSTKTFFPSLPVTGVQPCVFVGACERAGPFSSYISSALVVSITSPNRPLVICRLL
jgi:hypothetical protein